MKNKGQILVLFILIIPIIILILGLIIELGINYNEKRKINSTVKYSINYYFDNQNENDLENKIRNILNKNIKKNKSIDIFITNNYIKITVIKENKTILSGFNKDAYKIETTYKGYISDDKLIIEKE